jgi:signal transduction histidine kinase
MMGVEFVFLLLLAAALMAGERWRVVRQRSALNRALHEIRRPLQALALLAPGFPALAGHGRAAGHDRVPGLSGPVADPVGDPVLQAISAVGQLDRELNGGPAVPVRAETIACRLMADACVRRWQSRARLSGASIELAWSGHDVLVRGDGVALAAALENVIVNAIEHGGPRVTVAGHAVGRRVRIEVRDNGRDARETEHRGSPAEILARLRAGSAHGHGLAVASATVLNHGGKFETEFSDRGSRVVILLPVASRHGSASPVKVNW